MKNAWLITHDNHIDRRIFFFADSLHEEGFEVKLFGSFRNKEIVSSDPDYVIRPEIVETIENYKLIEEFRVDEIACTKTKEEINNVILKEIQYYDKYKKYATSKELLKKGLQLNVEFEYILKPLNDTFIAALRKKNSSEWFIYNDSFKTVRRTLMPDASAYRRLVREIYNYKKNTRLYSNPPLNNDDHCKIMVTKEGNCVTINCQEVGETCSYEYNSYDDVVIKRSSLPLMPIENDEVLGEEFDFTEFRSAIFDYSPILSRIKMELDMHPDDSPEIVYVADLPTLPIGIMLKKRIGCKLIIDCHEWWKEQSLLWEPQNKKRIEIIDKYEKSLYPCCDLRITVGHILAEKMGDYFAVPFKTIYSCLTSGVNTETEHKKRDFWSSKAGLPSNARVAIFQGSLTTLRNLDNLIRASKFLDDGNYLVIVGGGPYESEMKSILEREGNPDKVIFIGWVSQDELIEYTKHAQVGILPYKSINDYYSMSVPNKFLEYYSANLPIICDSSLKEISKIVIDEGIGITANCTDAANLGDKINYILNDLKLQAEFKSKYLSCGDKLSYSLQKKCFLEMMNTIS